MINLVLDIIVIELLLEGMINLVLDIIVIELCSARGCPLKKQVNIAISNQSALSGVILVLF
jgi:hypothetical protein